MRLTPDARMVVLLDLKGFDEAEIATLWTARRDRQVASLPGARHAAGAVAGAP